MAGTFNTGKMVSKKSSANMATTKPKSVKSMSTIKDSRKSTLPQRPALSQEYIVDSDSDSSGGEDGSNTG